MDDDVKIYTPEHKRLRPEGEPIGSDADIPIWLPRQTQNGAPALR